MKFSIVTSTFNCSKSLNITANSIRTQNYRCYEWIVIDGKSNDDTFDYINSNSDLISIYKSEKDTGIYQAWNKACDFITGDWVIFMGAGDLFVDSNVLLDVKNAIKNIKPDSVVVYGNVQIEDQFGNLRINKRKINFNKFEYGRPILPDHTGVFHSKVLFSNKALPFDESLRIAGDSKFLLEALKVGNFEYIDRTISQMCTGGVSNSYKNIFSTRNEIKKICYQLKIKIPIIIILKTDLFWIFTYLFNSLLPKFIKKYIKKLFYIL